MLSLSLFLFLMLLSDLQARQNDTTKTKDLEEVVVKGYLPALQKVRRLNPVEGSYIASGKKNEIITVGDLPANLAEKNGRQIFAKIPGVFIYDMDGSGNQVNISTRGLDPHRSWEYNIRQNGVMTNSDIYGYPASHYSPPMESIQRVELIRGTSSLQYGAQFGGMINYVVKEADATKTFGFESINSVGSFGLLSTYNAVGGKVGKLTYYGYYHQRTSEGYRDNSRSESNAQYLSLGYQFSDKVNLKAELGRSTYLYQIPGPLTDSMFYENPRQSTRSRNYFNPDIYVPSLRLEWAISPTTRIDWISSAVLGKRNSVQFVGFADVEDAIDPETHTYASRQVDIDVFNSYSSELRLRKDYNLKGLDQTLVVGIRYVDNDMHRRQQGKGTMDTDYDLSLISPGFGRDLHHKTRNVSLFAENLFHLTPKLSLSPGIRVEKGESNMSGKIAYLQDENVPLRQVHEFALLGISGQYTLERGHALYGGWSQAYRPIVMADIIPPTALDRTDENLKDSFGSNAEVGIRGETEKLIYDLSLFQLTYNNRVGSLLLMEESGSPYIYKTNTGNSRTNGVELFAEYEIYDSKWLEISLFTATSYFHAEYFESELRDGDQNVDISGNRLETVPDWISRNGLQVIYKGLSGIFQHSYVGESYSDAFNAETPSANGAKGLVPSYNVFDLNLSYRYSPQLLFKFGLNNIFDKSYFTKRPSGYPGSGVWSSDGRGVNFSVGFNL